MKKYRMSMGLTVLLLAGCLALFFAVSCSKSFDNSAPDTQKELEKFATDYATTNKNIETTDTLDFAVFTKQQWTRLHESHAREVIVNWPDGHKTNGIEKHIEDLKALFICAPDTRIVEHPVKFGRDGYTCVAGYMLGTFTKPMPIGGGKFIKPTNKKFNVPMCTVGKWKGGVMIEKWLYWDNQAYMKQIGLAK